MEQATIKVERDVPVPMRDGTVLRADVYRPEGPGRYPTLLSRSPYAKAGAALRYLNAVGGAFAGYAVVVQDVRGRFGSGGEFRFFHHEQEDGYDSVEWCAAQPWSNGRVGMYGGSYVGATQWQAAIAGPPSLRAIAPSMTASDYYQGWTYDGGAFQLGFNLSWVLVTFLMDAAARPERGRLGAGLNDLPELLKQRPLSSLSQLGDHPAARAYREWLAHPGDDAYWHRWNVEDRHDRITVPSLNVGGWWDLFTRGPLRNFSGMRARGGSEQARRGARLLVGPWEHTGELTARCGDRRLAVRAALLSEPLLLRWFDYWLKEQDNGLLDEPPVRLFVVGPDEWRTYEDWPPPGTRFERMYLYSGGRAIGLDGDGTLSTSEPGAGPPDRFDYNPADPVPSPGGVWNLADAVSGGMFDQTPVERRPDVLVFTSEPLSRALDVIGPVSVTLWAATSAPDTDWTAKLVDVTPEGIAWNVCDGVIRARYRQSFAQETPIEPNVPLEYTIDLRATAYQFAPGHRLRLEVSSSNFPRFDPNPNTGGPVAEATELRVARQTVYHDVEYPSHIVLPLQ